MPDLKTGIYQNLPDDAREGFLELRRKVRAHEKSLTELKEHEERFGESRDVEHIRVKVIELLDQAEADLRLEVLRLNATYAHLATSVRGRSGKKPAAEAGSGGSGKPPEDGG